MFLWPILRLYCAIFSVVILINVKADEIPNDSTVFSFVKSFKSIKKNTTYSTIKKSQYREKTEKFRGGCVEEPASPINGQLTCSPDSGCRANCHLNYKFPNGEIQLAIICNNGVWNIPGSDWTLVPHCEPICSPQCQNKGICIAPNECHCPEEFSGPQCQFENKPCLNYPSPVQHSHRQCNSKTCTISCLENFVFPNGASIANLICKNGFWQPTREDWVSIPDCQPVCSPPCESGGNCLPLNMCQCPQNRRGPQCQYSIDACVPEKMSFNGGYHCTGNADSYSCVLNCPTGIEFTSPPASEYVCTYEKGTFQPQPIPQCKNSQDYKIVPIESSHNSFFEVTNHSWSVENIYHSKSGLSQYNGARQHSKPKSYNIEHLTDNNEVQSISKIETMYPEAKKCFTWGGVHYKTFDGAIYSFESTCVYTLIQETRDNAFTVTVRNSPGCEKFQGLCYRIVKIFKLDKEYTLELDEDENPTLRNKNKALPIPAHFSGLRVEIAANFVIVVLDSIGITIKWDGQLLVEIEASESLWNRTKGLCGTMNGYENDDLTDRVGSYSKNIETLTASWRVEGIGEICDETPNFLDSCISNENLRQNAEEFCSKLLADRRFNRCSDIVNVALLKNACQWDYCACKQVEKQICACNTMNVYVRQCAHQKIVTSIGWRRNDTCPITCSNGRVYMSCGPKAQLSCSSDHATKSMSSSLRENTDNCEEGCFCDAGTVLHQGKCISPDQCPCRLRGKLFEAGASVPKDCNTCTCVSGKWICTETWCTARCAAIGDPHYVTFDGKHYDFMGKCNYYLIKGDNYSVETENVACRGAISESMGFERSLSDKPSCTKSVTVRMGRNFIKLKDNHQIMVNGEEALKLPLKVGGMKVRIASSIFVTVNMPNGLEIWWDGMSRVYVNAPPTFRGKTSGLCGTLTTNQKDDFLTPDGDVEQSVVPFANKWKTNERCLDIPKEDFSNPCDTKPQNRVEAKKHCSKLWSSLFSDCHWHVDPEPFYKDCMFDMCACELKIEQCLCPSISAYAKECASIGIKIHWRLEIEECKIHCPRGQEYQICGNSCTRSCSDILFNEDCKKQECVEGCNCPEGQSLDAYGECISIGQCPCSHAGLEFRAGYREVRPGSKSRELCTCAAGRWNCLAATSDDIVKYPAASGLTDVCTSSKNLKISSCEPLEPRTCRNMHQPIAQTPVICTPGCVCKNGYVLDLPSGECVKEEKCPCYHGGRSYKEGSSMNYDCNTCKCDNAKWNCTDRPCAGVCSAWGDSHFKTFDGRNYDFQGVCDYVLVKAHMSNDEVFQVSTQNVPCGNSGVSCSKSITFSVGSGSSQESVTLTRGTEVSKLEGKRMTMRQVGLFVFLDCPDLGIVVQWDKGTRVYVKVDPKWRGHTKGLCGDYNNNSEDDFKTPSGGISEVTPRLFGDSWKTEDYCSEPKDVLDTCAIHPERRSWAVEKCGILKSSVFEPCHSEVDIEQYLQRCIFDTCACDSGGDCECLCTALAAYAHECNAKGAPVKWRSQELCPLQCDSAESSYSSCMSTCPPATCDNVVTLKRTTHLCSEDSCIEGCLPKSCPDNQVYQNDTFAECTAKENCKLYCTTINGTTYNEGDEIHGDNCQSCFCSQGKKICNGVLCATPNAKLMEQTSKCISGWSSWINKYSPTKEKTTLDVEPLPSTLTLLEMPGSAVCTKDQMIDIRCRTIEKHETPKETGLDVECSLERGLFCQSTKENPRACLDFEISVLCQCDETTSSNPTISAKEHQRCNESQPNQRHPADCSRFYQCTDAVNGILYVEKSCGPFMLYNSASQICDWPANVIKTSPHCAAKVTRVTASTPPTDTFLEQLQAKTPNGLCEFDEYWSECAIPCDQTCLYYTEKLKKEGRCINLKDCLPGCVKPEKTCSRPSLWMDDKTCVNSDDCPCISNNGNLVKPSAIFKESECEYCQCLNNYYTCEKSHCLPEKGSTTTHRYETSTGAPTSTEQPKTSISIEESTIFVTSYVSLAPECTSKHYLPFSRSNLKDKIIFSSSSTNEFDNHIDDIFPKEWQTSLTDTEQWISVEFSHPEPIYGLIMLGGATEDKYVTSYRVLFSDDGRSFSYIKNHENSPKLFRGPIDRSKAIQQIFDRPIEAKIIRINPQTWHNGIAFRLDLLGCDDPGMTTGTTSTTTEKTSTVPSNQITILQTTIHTEGSTIPVCQDALGYDKGLLLDDQIIASSSRDFSLPKLKLSATGLWRSKNDNPHQYVQFDFLAPRNLTGIETKGAEGIWTTAFKVLYSVDGRLWNFIIDAEGSEKEFPGNFDDSSSRINYFDRPINARFLRINPILWHKHVGLKAEIYGCFLPYPTIPTTSITEPTTTATTSKSKTCSVCEGVIATGENETKACRCKENNWWNGASCVNKNECPCVVGSITYAVGAIYETDDCQRCICSLGGSSTCKRKICPKCNEPGSRSIVTVLCSCICKPCETGTKLCPTSNNCIDESLWCNGVDDCQDDEKMCGQRILPSVHVETGSSSTVNVTTYATLNVTKVVCEKPICPSGYKLAPTKIDYAKTKSFRHTGGSATKTTKRRNGIKIPRHPSPQPRSDIIASSPAEAICSQFSCVPSQPPTIASSTRKQDLKSCPKIECPPGYKVIYEKMSMNKLVACPKYTCAPPPPVEVICNVTGRTFNTFDNLEYKYDICNHILARHMEDNKWYITLERQCLARKSYCTRILVLMIDDIDVVLYPDLSVDIGDYRYTPRQMMLLGDIPAGSRGSNPFKICRIGETLYLHSDKYGFWIIWDKNSNVKLGLATRLANHIDGLCGYFDGYVGNDRQKPDGTLAKSSLEFGNSWIIDFAPQCETQTCPHDIHEKSWKMCTNVRYKSLNAYSEIVDLEKFLSRCMESTCTCIVGNKTEEDCRCQALMSFFTEFQAADHSIDISDWRTIHNCPIECPTSLVHNDCFKKRCEMSCSNLQESDPCPIMPGVCFSGCFCPDGMVRNGQQCVHPSECRDCICNAFGNSNFITFDKKNFTFIGNCTYILSRNINKLQQTENYTYEILMSNSPCESASGGVCTESITIFYENHVIKISKNSKNLQLERIVDGRQIKVSRLRNEWLNIDGIEGHKIVILIPAIQLEVTIFEQNFAFTIKLPSYTFGGAMEGLCGNCNGIMEDDLKLTDHEETAVDVNAFAMSWLKEETSLINANCASLKSELKCKTVVDEINSCTVLEDLDIFGNCHEFNDPTNFIDSCKKALCEQRDICGIIDAYARSCSQAAGLCIDWRSNELCPYQCPAHLQYKPCGCKKTCDVDLEDKCQESEATEGCFCPDNEVWHNETCIPEAKCLMCDEEGHVEGDMWHPDKCTNCVCSKKTVTCEKTDCSALETICEDRFRPVLVSGTKDACCPKYLCAPIPTTPAPIACIEQNPPECGFGQIMKQTNDIDGCPKLICECMPLENCRNLEIIMETEFLEPGYIQVNNTSGCCPRLETVCKPETCPSPPKCQENYDIVVLKQKLNSCCTNYNCTLSPNVCLYSSPFDNHVSKFDSTSTKKIGEQWKEGNCKTCTCQRTGNDRAVINCFETKCPDKRDDAETVDFVMEMKVIEGHCCPVFERKACREGQNVYHVNDTWYPNPADICTSFECVNKTGEVEKTRKTLNCDINCKEGYKYRPSIDKSTNCCGECIAVGCVVDEELKNIGEEWKSHDNCITYKCLINKNVPSVNEKTQICPTVEDSERKRFQLEVISTPHECCNKSIRKACINEGSIYQVGQKWSLKTDKCVTEMCVENEGIVDIKQEVQLCNTECPMGWKYQEPMPEKCCGECKETFCIVNGNLYQPNAVWYSNDNCTVFTCTEQNDQFTVSSSSPVCPDLTDCQETYFDGCCKRCNITKSNQLRACAAEVLDSVVTIGMLKMKRGNHGICKNLNGDIGLTECRGSCSSSTQFNEQTWKQSYSCECCQPKEMHKILVELTCEDGSVVNKDIFVPTSCACQTCGLQRKHSIKGH